MSLHSAARSAFSPIAGLSRGLKAYVRGVSWLRERPRYMALLSVPALIGCLFLVGGMALFAAYDHIVFGWILFAKPDHWLLIPLYYLAQILIYVAVVLLTFLTSFLLMNVVASPIYEIISVAVERDLTGQAPPDMSLRQQIAIIGTELKKVALILFVTLILLFIPGLNLFSTLVAAFLVGWDFFDYPLARRGWSLQQRLQFVRGEFWAVLGLGLWLMIPFLQIIMLPLAVAGGTLLNLDAQRRVQQLNPYASREEA